MTDRKPIVLNDSGAQTELADGDSLAANIYPPTTALKDYVVGPGQQPIFRRRIKMPAGTRIRIGVGSCLIGV